MEGSNFLMDWLEHSWLGQNVPDALWAQIVLGLAVLALLVLVSGWLVSRVFVTVARRTMTATGHGDWAQALTQYRVFRHISYVAPLLVIIANIGLLPIAEKYIDVLLRLLISIALVLAFAGLTGVLKAWQRIYSSTARGRVRSIKGYLELAKIVLWGVCAVLVFSTLIDRSPILMLSGLGALSAVLLLVFKDTLLSMVASTQMSSNDMLRIGDWIEMPQANADGFVIDMALHTVKVQNWDKTVTTIPTYKLFSESYRNWRHMFEFGGRRIKRTLRIDASSVRFLNEDEVRDLSRFSLLRDYLAGKENELQESNKALGDAASVAANRRRLTNIGTFRAYATAYVKQNREIRQDQLLLVRMLEPDSQGVPIELYCFSANTAWVEYERIQGDIFDHLLAILPELSLRLYQAPAGADFTKAWGDFPAAVR